MDAEQLGDRRILPSRSRFGTPSTPCARTWECSRQSARKRRPRNTTPPNSSCPPLTSLLHVRRIFLPPLGHLPLPGILARTLRPMWIRPLSLHAYHDPTPGALPLPFDNPLARSLADKIYFNLSIFRRASTYSPPFHSRFRCASLRSLHGRFPPSVSHSLDPVPAPISRPHPTSVLAPSRRVSSKSVPDLVDVAIPRGFIAIPRTFSCLSYNDHAYLIHCTGSHPIAYPDCSSATVTRP